MRDGSEQMPNAAICVGADRPSAGRFASRGDDVSQQALPEKEPLWRRVVSEDYGAASMGN